MKRVNYHMPQAYITQLEALAAQKKVSVAKLVRLAVARMLKDLEK